MDAQRQHRHKEWMEGLKAALAERQHRFEVQDLFADVIFRLRTAEAAAAKADQLGTTRFQGREADGKVHQINKIDGQWIRDDGKKLSDIQDEIDRASVHAIQTRARHRAALGPEIDAATDYHMALADAHAFRRIQNPLGQESAAVDMAHNARTYREYKVGLDKAIPGYPGTARKVYELAAAHHRKAGGMSEPGEPTAHRPEAALNAIEPDIETEKRRRFVAPDAVPGAASRKAKTPLPQDAPAPRSDGERVVPPEIEKRYLRVGDRFFHPRNPDLVAFEDKGHRLETKSNSEAIAESMVHIAHARGWDEIKVSGTETFRKEVWFAAVSRGMQVKGYTPSDQDRAELAKRRRQADVNQVENGRKSSRTRESQDPDELRPRVTEAKTETKPPSKYKRMAESFANHSGEEVVRRHPELAGAAACALGIDKQIEADGLTAPQQAVIRARVRQNIVNSIERGQIPQARIREERGMQRPHDAHPARELER